MTEQLNWTDVVTGFFLLFIYKERGQLFHVAPLAPGLLTSLLTAHSAVTVHSTSFWSQPITHQLVTEWALSPGLLLGCGDCESQKERMGKVRRTVTPTLTWGLERKPRQRGFPAHPWGAQAAWLLGETAENSGWETVRFYCGAAKLFDVFWLVDIWFPFYRCL